MVANNVRPRTQDHRYENTDIRDLRDAMVVRDHRDGAGPIVRPPPVVVHHHHHHHHHDHAAPPPSRPVAQDPGRTANAEFDNIFARGDLSIEDKIMMLLFSVMDKMDKEITEKGKKIGQAKSDAPGAANGGAQAGGNSAANGAASLDQQTLELQQLVSRRGMLFSTLNAIVNKFDESTDKVIRKLSQ